MHTSKVFQATLDGSSPIFEWKYTFLGVFSLKELNSVKEGLGDPPPYFVSLDEDAFERLVDMRFKKSF